LKGGYYAVLIHLNNFGIFMISMSESLDCTPLSNCYMVPWAVSQPSTFLLRAQYRLLIDFNVEVVKACFTSSSVPEFYCLNLVVPVVVGHKVEGEQCLLCAGAELHIQLVFRCRVSHRHYPELRGVLELGFDVDFDGVKDVVCRWLLEEVSR
jgi:hypothetical protein